MSTVKDEVIQAAGGLVWRRDLGTLKVAIVHRERYGSEWTLPKGKLEKNESWLQAAKREVSEEIGVEQEDLRVVNFAGGIVYPVNGKPKIVLYWNMAIDREPSFGATDLEVTKVKWLSPEDAVRLLKYSKEKEVLGESIQGVELIFDH